MQPAGPLERRIAAAAILVSGLVFAFLAPFARYPLGHSELFLPVYQSAQILCDLITAVFLFGHFGVVRSRLLLVLAGGYLFSATMAAFHLLAFPGLFSPTGLLGAGPQTAAWLYFIWHIGFPATVIAYAWSESSVIRPNSSLTGRGGAVLSAGLVAVVLAIIMLIITTAGHALLPVIIHGDHDRPVKYAVAWITWIITLSALPLLWRRNPVTTLDLWLMVVIVSWACDVAQAAVFNAGRFSMGWYTGRIYGLLAASFLLMMLILESGRLYRRLADSYDAERIQRRLVEERTAQLDSLKETLEQRVGERTKALADSNLHLERAREELKSLGKLSVAAREQERARIARDLHDELGQLLVLVKDQLWEVEDILLSLGDEGNATVARMQELVDLTLSTTKRIATTLRPDILDILGLSDAVDWLVGTFRERSSISYRLDIQPADVNLDEPWSTAVFRIIQESLTNVLRHANAANVDISLRVERGMIVLQICDDGCGFDIEAPRKDNAFGLVTMRERVYLVSGRIDIESSPGNGTRIDARIPLDEE